MPRNLSRYSGSLNSLGANSARFTCEAYAFWQSSLVREKGMIWAGRFSCFMRLSRIVEAPQ